MKKGDTVLSKRSGLKGTVHWVIENEASIKMHDDHASFSIVSDVNNDKDWEVIHEAAPSFQSQVAKMSDKDLRLAVESIRSQRIVTKTTKKKAVKVSASSDPVEAMLAKLPADQQEALRKKLGL